EMLVGSAALLIGALVAGEPSQVDIAAISTKSLLSLGYLIVFGSIVGYTAYTWLLRHAPPALATTYAYVNPIIAVLLGWAFAGESVTIWTLIASAVIVCSLVLITLPARRRAVKAPPVSEALRMADPGESLASARRG
ncbi:MAG: EamA family transporter, partial [Chloroflexota bacterium]|nr:EamA family transporter [Chloroflexota bacterium]